jgi:type IV secretion system protein TrbI
VLQKNLNIAPTIEVHAGFRLNVVPVKDLTFDKPYKAFDW